MRGSKGVLLMEVMVAIVVITGGLLFVMRVYSTAREALSRSRSLFKYSLLLEEKMYDFEERGVIEEGKDEGHFTYFKDYSWAVEAAALEAEALEMSDLCTVKLSVFANKSSSPDKYFLFTYLGKKKI